MKLYILLFVVLGSFNAFAGAGSSGGGDIDDLRRYHSLPEEKLRELLTTKSYLLKKMAVDLLKYNRPVRRISLPSDSSSNEEQTIVDKFYEAVDVAGEELVTQMILSANLITDEGLFKTFCSPEGYRAACTTNDVPGSIIFFSVERLMIKDTSLSELAGLFMHELSHWYIGEADHPSFEVGAYFEEVARGGSYEGKKFTLKNGDLYTIKKGVLIDDYYFWLASFTSSSSRTRYAHDVPTPKQSADTFCQKQGYNNAISYLTTGLQDRGGANYGFYFSKLGKKRFVREYNDRYSTTLITVFSEITCK